MKKLLNDIRGSTSFYAIFIILGLLVMFAGFFEYFRVFHIAKEYRREVQLCLDSYATKLGAEGYDTLRSLDVNDLNGEFLIYYNGYIEDSNKYITSEPDIQYEVIDNTTLKLIMNIDMTIPIYFGSIKASEVELNLEFVSRFRYKPM